MCDRLTRAQGSSHPSFIEAFGKGIDGKTAFFLEDGMLWTGHCERLRQLLGRWQKIQEGPESAKVSSFLGNLNASQEGALSLQLHPGQEAGIVSIEIVASNLAHYALAQFGLSIAGNASHRQCEVCSTWFAVGPEGSRPEKEYCSDACRMRAYRRRKKLSSAVSQSGEKGEG